MRALVAQGPGCRKRRLRGIRRRLHEHAVGARVGGLADAVGQLREVDRRELDAGRRTPLDALLAGLQACLDLHVAGRRRGVVARPAVGGLRDPAAVDHEHRAVVEAERRDHLEARAAAEGAVAHDDLLIAQILAGERDDLPALVDVESGGIRERIGHRDRLGVVVGVDACHLGERLGAPVQLPRAERAARDREHDHECEVARPAWRPEEGPLLHEPASTSASAARVMSKWSTRTGNERASRNPRR